MAKLCLALGLFILAGVFRQLDRSAPPLSSAVFFLLTNLIYIGLAMAWGFSISHRILHRGVRRYLMLGCAMAVLWLFLRAVKYRFFEAGEINRYLWYLYYVPQVLAPLFSLFAALQMGRREDEAFPGWWHLMDLPAALLIGGVLTNNLHHQAFRPALGAETARIFSALTAGRYDKVLLDRSLSLSAQPAGDAVPRALALLSQGAGDQLYLAARLAICRMVLPQDKAVPLILDDALANFDDTRMAAALDWLLEESRTPARSCFSPATGGRATISGTVPTLYP